jgi:TonB-linked SusC/RagA family outer membrane protein
MSTTFHSRWLLVALVSFFTSSAVAYGQAGAAASGTATITGTILDSTGHTPLAGVQVSAGPEGVTSGLALRGTRTTPDGHFTITGVAPGAVVVRTRLLGYQPVSTRITVRAGETATVNLSLHRQTALLDQVVVTGTAGATQRRAVGNVIESIKATDVLEVAPVTTVDQLVGGRTPGLIVLPSSGQVGTGAQLRVRGVSSLSLTNEPLVYIDGVRMDANASRGPTQRGAMGASALNDIAPEDIESIEVIKGPAAGTLYGTEASNGVIQIITKRGRSGKPSWNFSTRLGTNWLANPEGRSGTLYAKNLTTGQIDSTNLYIHESKFGNGPIFTNGTLHGSSLSLAGGSDATRYFTSLNYDNDVGVVPWNTAKKLGARANLDLLVGSKLKIGTSVGYIRNRTRLAQGAIDIDPFSNLIWGTPLTLDKGQRGFNASPPEEWSTVESHADVDRTTASLTTNYTPISWFTNRLVAGLDASTENNWTLYPRQPNGSLDFLGNNGLGSKTVGRALHNYITLDYSGSAKAHRGDNLDFTSSIGLQYYHQDLNVITAVGSNFPAIPITTVSGGATRSGTETYTGNATVGVFGQQEVAWRNRVFLTAALRGDDNSAFGKQFKAAYYPKFSGSWVIGEEPWFHVPGVNTLRLRAAFGASGTQPGAFDASQLYDPTVGYKDQPGLVPGSFGNPALKPELSRELEVGFESTILGGSTDVSYTHYQRNITDAIVNTPLAPSGGFPGSQIVNIGRVSGWGNELAVTTRLVDRPRVAWEVGTQLASNGNRIEDMGGIPFITIAGGQAQNRVGFGIGDIFMYKVLSATLDPKGFVTSSVCDGGRGRGGLEQGGAPVPCSAAPRVRWGASQPLWQLGVNTTVTLFRNLRLYAAADGNGGGYQSDTEIRALHNLGLSRAVIDRNNPLLQTYRGIENDATGTYLASFVRLRELSATYTLPTGFVGKLGANRGSIGLAMRNVAMLWTGEQGWNTSRDGLVYVPVAGQHTWDPETRASGQLSQGYQTILPPVASFTANLRLSF